MADNSEARALNWWLAEQGATTGPYTTDHVAAGLRSGSIAATTQACRVGDHQWRLLTDWPEFAEAAPPVPPPPPPPPESSPSEPTTGPGFGLPSGCIGVVLMAALFGAVKSCVLSKVQRPAETVTSYKPVDNSFDSIPVESQPTGAARLSVSWSDATAELIAVTQQMTAQERAALGITVLATGMDIYAARINIRNSGSVPVRVYPQNLAIHFGDETAQVYTINDPKFLRAQILQPGASTTGLVCYTARVDIGAAIRTGGGAMSYTDPTIEVNYD